MWFWEVCKRTQLLAKNNTKKINNKQIGTKNQLEINKINLAVLNYMGKSRPLEMRFKKKITRVKLSNEARAIMTLNRRTKKLFDSVKKTSKLFALATEKNKISLLDKQKYWEFIDNLTAIEVIKTLQTQFELLSFENSKDILNLSWNVSELNMLCGEVLAIEKLLPNSPRILEIVKELETRYIRTLISRYYLDRTDTDLNLSKKQQKLKLVEKFLLTYPILNRVLFINRDNLKRNNWYSLSATEKTTLRLNIGVEWFSFELFNNKGISTQNFSIDCRVINIRFDISTFKNKIDEHLNKELSDNLLNTDYVFDPLLSRWLIGESLARDHFFEIFKNQPLLFNIPEKFSVTEIKELKTKNVFIKKELKRFKLLEKMIDALSTFKRIGKKRLKVSHSILRINGWYNITRSEKDYVKSALGVSWFECEFKYLWKTNKKNWFKSLTSGQEFDFFNIFDVDDENLHIALVAYWEEAAGVAPLRPIPPEVDLDLLEWETRWPQRGLWPIQSGNVIYDEYTKKLSFAPEPPPRKPFDNFFYSGYI